MTTPSDAGRAGEREVSGDVDRVSEATIHVDLFDVTDDEAHAVMDAICDIATAAGVSMHTDGHCENSAHYWGPGSRQLATQIAAAEQRGCEDERERIADLDARCARAEEQLREGQAAHERNGFDTEAVRLSGKREGVALARDYLRALLEER